MKVYIFDSTTNEYLREEEAFIEPRGETVLLPRNGTFISPHNTLPQQHVQVFNRSHERWDIVPDHRGQEVFNATTCQFEKIFQLGELPKDCFIITPETKAEYFNNPEHFDVTQDGIVKKSQEEIENIEADRLKREKRRHRQELFSDADWRILRAMDCGVLQIPCPDDHENLISYRQYLRDFTELDGWWRTENGIKTFEEFVKTEKI